MPANGVGRSVTNNKVNAIIVELVYAAENGGEIAVEVVTDQLEGMDIMSVLTQVILRWYIL